MFIEPSFGQQRPQWIRKPHRGSVRSTPAKNFLYDRSLRSGMLEGSLTRNHLHGESEVPRHKERERRADAYLEDGHPEGICVRAL